MLPDAAHKLISKKIYESLENILNVKPLRDPKKLKKYEPEQFEKLITEALKIINDEIAIKPNCPVDDDGEAVNHFVISHL